MKKAKLMLASIALLAIVSGVLASTTIKRNVLAYYYCNLNTNKCLATVVVGGQISTAAAAGLFQFTSSGTLQTVAGANCAAQGCVHPLYASPGQ